jgi:hypothetical protein
VIATAIGLLPSRRNHWPQAYVLIAVGIPLLGYVTYQHGPWIALLVAAGGVSVLRWPAWSFLKWLRRKATGAPAPERERILLPCARCAASCSRLGQS